MNINIHIFAGIVTFIFYFILRIFKNDICQTLTNENKNKKQSNLIYVLFAPGIVYVTYYLFSNKKELQNNINLQESVNILPKSPVPSFSPKSIYPVESTLSSMSY